ncbi:MULTISPECIES: VpsD family glycosyltransferase [Vibrio]|uniref:Exopolysaccharide biosynthesis protein EpsF n=1 Tax=Vibrio genomosp. F6 str. FF-238 TaxID=1191298 RepID=A0A1E5CMR6_9VIBR|nr:MULTISPECIES: VpsD family glycosyltransferase [Vibrio]MDN3697935.1 VpsD family glycosyltransferase [Vibrio cortegadensis]OEE71103.1 exopolysaccharide biosynthesis protein EpsF [Vibrio genomosp. F6 str. FF-238]
MKKILLIVPLSTVKWGSENAGGVDSVCQQIIRSLAEKPPEGYMYEIVAIKVGTTDVELFEQYALHERVTLTFIPEKETLFGITVPGFVYHNYFLYKKIKESQPDIVHSHLISLPLFSSNNVKSILTLHSFGKIARKSRGFFNNIIFESILPKMTLSKANMITCVGDIIFDEVKGEHLHKLVKIGNPIDSSFFHAKNSRSYGDSVIRLVTCALITPRKQIDLIIELTKTLSSSINVELTIIGPDDNEYSRELKIKTENLNISEKVHWMGAMSQAQIIEQYELADLGVFLSKEETFGLAPLEMLAAGLPLISTSVGILDEKNSFFRGLGVCFIDVNRMDDEVSRILAYINSVKTIDRDEIKSIFSIDSVVEKYQVAYGNINSDK